MAYNPAPPPLRLTGVRTWQGDVVDLPPFMGPVDGFIFNAVFANLADQREALLRAALMMRPGGRIIISHPMGRAWLAECVAHSPQVRRGIGPPPGVWGRRHGYGAAAMGMEPPPWVCKQQGTTAGAAAWGSVMAASVHALAACTERH